MNTADFNHKDKHPVTKCDAQLQCVATPQLQKTVAEELKDEDMDIETLLKEQHAKKQDDLQ
jgi:hypothetical protein